MTTLNSQKETITRSDMDTPETAIFLRPVIAEIPRLLSWQDREPLSKTHGCFDRNFWGWKFVDFPGARFQEGVYSLSWLFMHSCKENPLAGNERVLEWIRAGMEFWRGIQYADGSYDEAYPFEHSLAATAFTTFYIGEAFLMLNDDLEDGEKQLIRESFERAGRWLCHNDEHHGVLSNHLAAAAAALEVVYQITDASRYRERSQHFLQRIYERQSTEGWYEEYGGADPGYQTHGTFYLARIWQYTQDNALLKSLKDSVEFLKYFIHPDRTLGGEYGSRNTEFYFPAGFEILAARLSDAADIAAFMRPALAERKVAGVWTMDAYNFFPMLNNYLFAAENAMSLDTDGEGLPCKNPGEMFFEDAGLLVKTTPRYHAVVGLSKGGVVKLFDGKTGCLAGAHCGYWAETDPGHIITSQGLNRQRSYPNGASSIEVESSFARMNQRTQDPFTFLAFRVFTLTFGRIALIARLVKKLLVHVLVTRKRHAPLRLRRRIIFGDNGVILSDKIDLSDRVRVRRLHGGQKFSAIHMGSSRYFQHQELSFSRKEEDLGITLTRDRTVKLMTELVPQDSE